MRPIRALWAGTSLLFAVLLPARAEEGALSEVLATTAEIQVAEGPRDGSSAREVLSAFQRAPQPPATNAAATSLLPAAPAVPPPLTIATPAPATLPSTGEPRVPASDAQATAVALNYCRAAFHRIRRDPTKPVLAQEQEKILNNINLDGIADQEVITLYTSVLDEINQIGIADYERSLLRKHHGSNIQRKLTWDALAFGADLALGQYGNAIRTGANSWWDYRVMSYQRDMDVLRVDKTRMVVVVQKSSTFLDTFWKMAQKKKIPDRWLVRGDDLDALDEAMQETDPEKRLRVLKRMEPFMESYPPYWYYVGRTQQELGQLFAAANTYSQLLELGHGHFRKDDMLATGLANKAAIQDYLGQPTAAETAAKALEYSTDVWEANLICARILQRARQFAVAEDAILRNLDVDLETTRSRVFLASLYYHAEERDKLLRLLADEQVVAQLPAPVLLRCAAFLGAQQTPPHVLRAVTASLEGQPRMLFGPDEFVLRASSTWQLHLASLTVVYDGQELANPEVTAGNGFYQLRYTGRFEWGNPLGSLPPAVRFDVKLTYPDQTVIRLALQPGAAESSTGLPGGGKPILARNSPATLRIAEIQVGTSRLAVSPAAVPATPASSTSPVTDIPLPPKQDTTGS
jgi:hypothetical protein